MAVGKLHGDIKAPVGYIGELVSTSLRACGWQGLSYNDLTQEITAEQKKIEKRGGMAWPFEYRLSASWRHEGEVFKLTVQIQDREQHSIQRDCEKLCYDVIKGVVERAETLQDALKRTPRRTTYGNARWANIEDLNSSDYIQDSVQGNGLLIGPWEDGKKLVIPQSEAIRHVVVCGPTGCGKSSSVFIPNLIERSHVSVIVTEATSGAEKPDLYSKTAGYRASKGSKIFYFNPDDLSSTRINPVDMVTSVAKAQEVADLIMSNTTIRKSTGDPFWETAEKHLLTSLLMHESGEKGNLANIRRHIREGVKSIEAVVETSKVSTAKDEYRGFIRNSTENTRNSVLAGMMQRLNLWINPRIVALTEKTDFDPATLFDSHFSFYLAVPAQKEYLKPMAALAFNFLLELALGTKDKAVGIPFALFLDEFTNFGTIQGFAKKIGTIRHQEIPVMLGMQDYVQLRSSYGDDDATQLFTQPATRFIFRTNDLPTAKKTSESLGHETVVDRKLTTTCQVNEKEFGKLLMSPAEVMTLDPAYSVLFTASTPPIKLKRFSWRDYVDQMNIKLPPRPELKINEDLITTLEKQAKPADWEGLDFSPADKPGAGNANETNNEKIGDNDGKSDVVKAKDGSWKPKEIRVVNDDDETLPI